MKLSIVIVNYNVRYFLQQCLQSVQKAITGLDAEVFVVDNNSTDGSVEMVQQLFPDVILIANKVNTGFSKANNQAIRKSTGEYVLLLNPDTVVEEQTFSLVCSFMDQHPDAGGLGVKMIDGNGEFLPESKRGLPTPSVAFYKIFGLSAMFPKSKVFGKYHLGYLDKESIHEIEVLSGAFMLLRKSALDKTGLLDEDYFMYGEDIDLSYRILKAGYKNYYYPGTKIIHYKGESTKKDSVNYVIVFYKAMIIFARKHFAPGNAAVFSALINFAVWLRAGAAILIRFIERFWLPFIDALLFFGGMLLLKNYWEHTVKDVVYPAFFTTVVIPVYLLIWIVAAYFSGGYDMPVRLSRYIRGILTGTIVILVIYALLPEGFRFSRALILLGAAWACVASAAVRLLLHFSGIKKYRLADRRQKRLLIVGDAIESQRILSLLMMGGNTSSFAGYVSAGDADDIQDAAMQSHYLGNINALPELISLYDINEVIFCGKSISSGSIMDMMLQTQRNGVEFKIAPPESLFIIGSNSINENGDLYLVDLTTLNNAVNRRNKRLFDLITSLAVLITSPLLFLFIKKPGKQIRSAAKVFSGRNSWVGLHELNERELRNMKPGIYSPADAFPGRNLDAVTKVRLQTLYAKEYKVLNDFRIVTANLFAR